MELFQEFNGPHNHTTSPLSIFSIMKIHRQGPQPYVQMFEDVIIPTDASMLFYNVSESSIPILLSRMDFDPMSFLLSEDQFLLVDAKRCSDCRFQLLIKPIAVKYECNSTLRLAQGALELVSHSPASSCELFLQAPPYHRVLLKTSTTAADNCSPQKLFLGVPTQTIWGSDIKSVLESPMHPRLGSGGSGWPQHFLQVEWIFLPLS
ncbi:protocadherin Fat 1 [Trichonephila clavipes]|nr:protocadherin Fat 1 [Trichonephila clavipes]